MKRSLCCAFSLFTVLGIPGGLAGCSGVPEEAEEEGLAVVEEAPAGRGIAADTAHPRSVRPETLTPPPLTDADFERPTCGLQDFTAAQIKAALAGQPTQEFDGVTVRHRTRRCVATTEYGAGTCSAWEPTVTGTNRKFSITIYRYPGGGWVKPYRYVKMVGGSSLDPATFRVRYSDPDIVPFIVESTSLTDMNSTLYCDAAESRSNDTCLWVKGRLKPKKRTAIAGGYEYTERELLYTAYGYKPVAP